MLNLITRLVLDQAAADRFAAALPAFVAATKAEPGCVNFIANRSTQEPGVFWMIEEFVSQEALDAHMQTAHLAALAGEFGNSFLEAPAMHFVDPIA